MRLIQFTDAGTNSPVYINPEHVRFVREYVPQQTTVIDVGSSHQSQLVVVAGVLAEIVAQLCAG